VIHHRKWRALFRVSILAILTCVILFGCDGSDRRDLEKFSNSYATLHDSKDVEGLMELIQIRGNNPAQRKLLRTVLLEETQSLLADIQFERIKRAEADILAESLPTQPTWRVYVILNTEDRFTSVWLAGETEDGLRLLLPAAETMQEME